MDNHFDNIYSTPFKKKIHSSLQPQILASSFVLAEYAYQSDYPCHSYLHSIYINLSKLNAANVNSVYLRNMFNF
jgi:hypothetical protein